MLPNKRILRRVTFLFIAFVALTDLFVGNLHLLSSSNDLTEYDSVDSNPINVRHLNMLEDESVKRTPDYLIMPTIEWTFDDDDTRDTFLRYNGTLLSGALVDNGFLNIPGKIASMTTFPLSVPTSSCTLELVVYLESLADTRIIGFEPVIQGSSQYLNLTGQHWTWSPSDPTDPFEGEGEQNTSFPFHLIATITYTEQDYNANVQIYRNGTYVFETNFNSSFPLESYIYVGPNEPIVGRSTYPLEFSLVRFYNRSLSTDEIMLLFNNMTTSSTSTSTTATTSTTSDVTTGEASTTSTTGSDITSTSTSEMTTSVSTTLVNTTDGGGIANATFVITPVSKQPPALVAAVVAPSFFTFVFCGFGFYIRKKYQKWRIRKDMIVHNVKVLERLGGGNFGEVFKGIWNGTTIVALKRLKTDAQLEEFRREAVMLYTLKHIKVVQFLGLYSTGGEENYRYIVTEFMALGSASDLIASRPLSQVDLISIARQACAGMICLSTKGVIHRDLALRNIMVTHGNDKDRYIAKVGDMGLAMKSNDTEGADTPLPIRWAAPECYLHQRFSTASDVWSFGIVLYELFTNGQTPYKGMSNRQVIEKVTEGYRLDKPENCPTEVYRLMRMCWETDPEKRPTFVKVFEELERIGREVKLEDNVEEADEEEHERVTNNKKEEPVYNDTKKEESSSSSSDSEGVYNNVQKKDTSTSSYDSSTDSGEEQPTKKQDPVIKHKNSSDDSNDIELQVYN